MALARYGHHTLAHPVGRRLAIVGDAAHSTSPQLGQGANMALLDARALAHALAVKPTVEDALQAYARMRRLHVRVFQALSFAFTPFYQSDSTVLPFIRDRLVRDDRAEYRRGRSSWRRWWRARWSIRSGRSG